MFEVAGTHFEKGVFEIHLDKKAPVLLRWIFRLGPLPARMVGIGILAFSFIFSTSKAPIRFMLEQGYSQDAALSLQQGIGYAIFGVAVAFYMIVFLFRQEKMTVAFNKASKLYTIVREPIFRFTSSVHAHTSFADIKKIEKLEPTPEAPHGRVLIRADKLPDSLKAVEFSVLSDEQFEYFPLNLEKVLGT